MQESSRPPLNALPEEEGGIYDYRCLDELFEQFYKLIELLKQKKRVCNKDIGLMSEVCEQFYWLTEEKKKKYLWMLLSEEAKSKIKDDISSPIACDRCGKIMEESFISAYKLKFCPWCGQMIEDKNLWLWH